MKYDFDHIPERKGTNCIKFDELKETFGRDDLIPMWIADMDYEVAPAISEALSRRMEHHVFGYSHPTEQYWQSIIGWLGRRHGMTVAREHITFVPGIVKAVGLAINFYTKPGDKILIQPPVYHPFKRLTEGNGRICVENPLRPAADGFYEMDMEGLDRVMDAEKPRMMVLCNPHNPIGIQWSRETLAEVARIAKKHDVIVISDEIHADLMLGGKPHFPFLEASPEAAEVGIMFGAPSKTFNIAGLVSSWCVIRNPKLREPFFNWLEVNELNAATQVAAIATQAAYDHGEEWLDECLEYMQANIDFMDDYVKRHIPKAKIVRPQASYLVWLDLRGLGLDARQLERFVVDKAHLALNPGDMFGPGGEGFMRFNIGTSREVLKRALDNLKAATEAL